MSMVRSMGVFIDEQDFVCSGRSCKAVEPDTLKVFKKLQEAINGALYYIAKKTKKYPTKPIAVDGIIGPATVNACQAVLNSGYIRLNYYLQNFSLGATDVKSLSQWAYETALGINQEIGSVPAWAREGKTSASGSAPSANAPAWPIPWWLLLVGGYVLYRGMK